VPLLVLAVIALAILIVVGRQQGAFRIDPRVGPALAALAAAAVALATALRGQWIASIVLIVVSGYFGAGLRRGARRSDLGEPMRPDEAREILGVGDAADRPEIEAAYRRLMLRAHPDRGGSTGLAAKLNAARDRLLKKS